MIAKHQNQLENMEVFAITSPFYPQKETMIEDFQIDGINYSRCVHPARKEKVTKISHRIIKKRTRISRNSTQINANVDKHVIKRVFDFFYFGILKIGRLVKKPFSIVYKVWEEHVLMNLFEAEIEQFILDNNIDIVHAHAI